MHIQVFESSNNLFCCPHHLHPIRSFRSSDNVGVSSVVDKYLAKRIRDRGYKSHKRGSTTKVRFDSSSRSHACSARVLLGFRRPAMAFIPKIEKPKQSLRYPVRAVEDMFLSWKRFTTPVYCLQQFLIKVSRITQRRC